MSAWLDGPIVGPLVDGDLCEVNDSPNNPRARCDSNAVMIAENLSGSHVTVCRYHAERHGLVPAARRYACCERAA